MGTVYVIQRSKTSKSWVVNHDKLKPARLREPLDTSWAHSVQIGRRRASEEEAEDALKLHPIWEPHPYGSVEEPPGPNRKR